MIDLKHNNIGISGELMYEYLNQQFDKHFLPIFSYLMEKKLKNRLKILYLIKNMHYMLSEKE